MRGKKFAAHSVQWGERASLRTAVTVDTQSDTEARVRVEEGTDLAAKAPGTGLGATEARPTTDRVANELSLCLPPTRV